MFMIQELQRSLIPDDTTLLIIPHNGPFKSARAPRPARIIQRVKLVKHRQMSAPTALGHFQPGGNARE